MSKYVTGQGLAIGGMMVEREGLSDLLKNNERYEQFNTPDESYHGLVYADLPLPIFSVRARLSLARDIGAIPQPFASWLFIQGLETLSIRMARHSENALKVAEFLKAHPKVKSVKHPMLKGDENYELAQKYLKGGSGLVSFDIGDFDAAKAIMNQTKLFSRAANIGDSKSIITHSASTTHQQLSTEELKACGVNEGLIRLSIGLEDADDLIADLKAAMG
jgi:O-acetylhomoserine (thiol)-lyase